MITKLTYALAAFACLFYTTSLFSQPLEYDTFDKKALPNWTWGGLEMKYSHETDNAENGYAELIYSTPLKANNYIGKITKYSPILLVSGNFLNVMLQGVKNDVTVKIEVLYDVDNNNKYNDDQDIMLQSKPFSLNYEGWKEVKIKLDEDNFKLISNYKDDFTVTEEDALGIQIEFETGPNYKEGKFESGIAVISEIPNKENLSSMPKFEKQDTSKERESYYKAKNFPNPFNPTTTISFTLPEATNVELTVYDRLGREVVRLLDTSLGAGTHTAEFNAKDYPSGIYFYRIKTTERTEVRKMILSK
ncbi:MAG: T9SS type A sorting domain-containing protein [Bacteroidetes bacterium]|nr:T9SS type A sorting domain-containing protein [Bacteroidota bacterium]